MKIKREYSFSNHRQIWRLLPTDSGKIVIEERNVETKEVFFNCLDSKTGKKIFSSFQLEEKFWVGIETIYKDILYFHKYMKPDMPHHKGIIAYDAITNEILWENNDAVFLFILNNKIYCFRELFEVREFYSIDYRNGRYLDEFKENAAEINILREESLQKNNFEGYYFTEYYNPENEVNPSLKIIINNLFDNHKITGRVEFIKLNDLLLLSYHEIVESNKYNNIFLAVDIADKKIIFEEKLNTNVRAIVPDSFFVKDDLIFLLKEKEKLLVCSLKL